MPRSYRSRHDPNQIVDRAINVNDTLFYWLELLDPSYGYDMLPTNWLLAFAPISARTGKPQHPEYVRHYLGDLTRARAKGPQQLLAHITLDGERNLNETMKYFRTERGHTFMHQRKYPMMSYYRSKTPDHHQLMGCLRRASLELGMRRDGVKLDTPKQIFKHEKMGAFDMTLPYTFYLCGQDHKHARTCARYTPDDDPLVARWPAESKLLLFEDDMDTEGISRELGPKFDKIVKVWSRRHFEQKYGHKAALLLFSTVSERHAMNVRDFLSDRYKKPLPFILIKAFPEFAKLHKTIPVTMKAWDEPWMRPGCPDYSLRILAPVDKLGVPKNDPTYRSPEEKFLNRQNNPHGAGGAFRGMKQ